jgi:hypothetical protein
MATSHTVTIIRTKTGGYSFADVAQYDSVGHLLSNPPHLVTRVNSWTTLTSLGLTSGHHYLIIPCYAGSLGIGVYDGDVNSFYYGFSAVGYWNGSTMAMSTPGFNAVQNSRNAVQLAYAAIYDLGLHI